MRRSVLAVALGLVPLLACGEAVKTTKPSPRGGLQSNGGSNSSAGRSIASEPVDIVAARRQNVLGALERPTALRRFFESLARVESGEADDDVRITQFGDSHTAADIQTRAVRSALQLRFGDGGRGFVAIGKPWKLYLQDGVRVGMSSEWVPEKAKLERGKVVGDGLYGLSGIGLFTRRRGARAWADVASKTSRAELAYLEQPRGGAFDVVVDGVRVVRVSTRGERPSSAFRTFELSEHAVHQVEVRAVGDGDVRVFGMTLERAQHGVVLDALGINGARITTALAWNEQHWADQLKHRSPSLVILAYGTNESTDTDLAPATYERQLVDALGRVARAVPGASCLLLGPPDRAVATREGWVTAPKIREIISVQRRVAEAAGCAFYDQFLAMGGDGSIAAWATEEPPRAQKDRVHLMREGYSQLGSSFAADLMRAYASWRRDAGLPPSGSRDASGSPAALPPTRPAFSVASP